MNFAQCWISNFYPETHDEYWKWPSVLLKKENLNAALWKFFFPDTRGLRYSPILNAHINQIGNEKREASEGKREGRSINLCYNLDMRRVEKMSGVPMVGNNKWEEVGYRVEVNGIGSRMTAIHRGWEEKENIKTDWSFQLQWEWGHIERNTET